MARLTSLLAPLACAGLLACSTLQVSQDFDPQADFTGYRSYAWLSHEQAETGDIRVDSPLLHQRIRTAIEDNLETRGYRPQKTGVPDFYVGYHLSLESRLDVRTINAHHGYGGYGRYGRWGTVGYPETRVSQYEQGTLIIDVADAGEKKLVWRGWASDRIRRNPSQEESEQKVRDVVAKVMEQFPPR